MEQEESMNEAAALERLSQDIEAQGDDTVAEESADCLVKIYDLCPTEEDKRNTANTVRSFVTSYAHKDKALGDEPWLDAEFAKHPKIWKDDAERQEAAHTIVDAV